jgi:hypothetical protein
MAKADVYFTLHFWGDNDNFVEVDKDEMQEALESMIEDVLDDCDIFNYKASLTNHLTGVTVEQSREASDEKP